MLPTRMRCCGVIASCVSRFAKPAASTSPSIQTMAPIAPAAVIESVHILRGPDQPYSTFVGARAGRRRVHENLTLARRQGRDGDRARSGGGRHGAPMVTRAPIALALAVSFAIVLLGPIVARRDDRTAEETVSTLDRDPHRQMEGRLGQCSATSHDGTCR